MKNKIVLCLIVLVLLPLKLVAADFDLDLVSQYGKGDLYYKNIIINNNYLYNYNVAEKRLEIIDISNKEKPVLDNSIKYSTLNGNIEIDRKRNLLFISLSESIDIYDITTPNNLTKAAEINNQYLNGGEEYTQLKLYKDNYLIVSALNALKIFDISNLNNINLVGNYKLGEKREHGCLVDFEVLNDKYILSERTSGFCWPHEKNDWGNYVIDVSDVSQPVFVTNIKQAVNKMAVKGDYGYSYDIHHDGSDYAKWYDEVVFYDLSNINNVKELKRIKLQQGDVTAISKVGIWHNKYLYYIRGNKLTVFDISYPSDPVLLIKEFDFFDNFDIGLGILMESWADDNYIYFVLSRNGLVILSYELDGGELIFNYPDNILIKGNEHSGVFIIKDGAKRLISSPTIFNQNNFKWSKIIEINQKIVDSFATADNFLYKDGKVLRDNLGKIYIISHNKKRQIADLATLKRFNFLKIINGISLDVLQIYENGKILKSSDFYPDGVLLKSYNKSAVYYIWNGEKHPIYSADVFEAYGNSWDEIIAVTEKELASYPLGKTSFFPTGSLIKAKNKSAVYLVDNNGKVRPIISAKLFERLGYKWDFIYEVPENMLNNYSIGEFIRPQFGRVISLAFRR